jgi:hypothetical protein
LEASSKPRHSCIYVLLVWVKFRTIRKCGKVQAKWTFNHGCHKRTISSMNIDKWIQTMFFHALIVNPTGWRCALNHQHNRTSWI